jgi:hypothetical protein
MEEHGPDQAARPLHQVAADQSEDEGKCKEWQQVEGVLNLGVEGGEDDRREEVRGPRPEELSIPLEEQSSKPELLAQAVEEDENQERRRQGEKARRRYRAVREKGRRPAAGGEVVEGEQAEEPDRDDGPAP